MRRGVDVDESAMAAVSERPSAASSGRRVC